MAGDEAGQLLHALKNMSHPLYSTLMCLALLLAGQARADTPLVVYPRGLSANDSQYLYDYELLRLALEKTSKAFGPYDMRPSDEPMNQARAAIEIMSGSGLVTIFARSTSIKHEADMLPIRIPIDKGLVSYRVFLVRAEDQVRFANVQTLEQLQKFSVGSFTTWTDTDILRDGGFNVVTGVNYESLFKMLSAGRFDFFRAASTKPIANTTNARRRCPTLRWKTPYCCIFRPRDISSCSAAL